MSDHLLSVFAIQSSTTAGKRNRAWQVVRGWCEVKGFVCVCARVCVYQLQVFFLPLQSLMADKKAQFVNTGSHVRNI